MHETANIGASGSKPSESEFREMTLPELVREPFSDYFRFSFTLRMDRDDALALARRIESIVTESRRTGDCRVYLGVRNR